MDKFFYGSFEKILRSHITPKITQKDLADILLTAAFIDARSEDKWTSRSSQGLDSATLSKFCSGSRGLPARLAARCSDPDALEYATLCFDTDILPRIPGHAREVLKEDILSLTSIDDSIPAETKSYFSQLAAKNEPAVFLAETLLFALCRKGQMPSATRKAIALPARNRSFCGRSEDLKRIRERYRKDIHVQGLSGMGGIGKTQLALQYAYLHLTEYKAVCWINAANEPTVQGSISNFLLSQGDMPENRRPENLRETFLDYLDRHTGWLLIYDNAEYGTPEGYQMLEHYFPGDCAKGNILLTTRCRAAFGEAVQMEVALFTEDEAVLFLQRRSGFDEDPYAATLARQLGFLPLALEYASAYIRETPGVDCLAYSRRLERAGIKVLDRRVGYQAYKNTVREAFHITLDRLVESAAADPVCAGAWQFLNLCAFLAPEGIEVGIFSRHGAGLPEPVRSVLQDELDRDELMRNLTRYSLVQLEGGIMSMHRLLQEVLQDEIGLDEGLLCINYAFGVFYSAFYSMRTAQADGLRLSLAPSVPHVQAILLKYIRHCRNAGYGIPDRIMAAKEFFSWTGLLLEDIRQTEGEEQRENCKENIQFLQTALGFYRILPGPETIYHAYLLMLLAQAREKIGDSEAAASEYLQSLAVMEKAIGQIPTDAVPGRDGTLGILYRDEAFQLSSDICAAIGSSRMIYSQPKILWGNYRGLVGLLRRLLAYFPYRADAHLYKETWLYLWIYSKQVADCTQRAFSLNLKAPENWQKERGSLLPDGPFGFFIPTAGPHPDVPADMPDGFDILLKESNGNEFATMPDRPWMTLAFSERVRTEEDMLDTMTNTGTAHLDAALKRPFYAAVSKLAEHLNRDDVAALYKEKLYELL